MKLVITLIAFYDKKKKKKKKRKETFNKKEKAKTNLKSLSINLFNCCVYNSGAKGICNTKRSFGYFIRFLYTNNTIMK